MPAQSPSPAIAAPAAVKLPRPPGWLVLATGALALSCLALAIAETNLWAHYLIGQGKILGLLGLAFIFIAGLFLFRQGRLLVSLPLVFPWLLYPVITQGDQIIDNFSINPMRVICQVLLAAIFAMPVVAVVLAARYALTPKAGAPVFRRPWTAWFPGLRPLAEGRVPGRMAAARDRNPSRRRRRRRHRRGRNRQDRGPVGGARQRQTDVGPRHQVRRS